MSTLLKRVSASTLLSVVFVLLLSTSVAAAAYRYIYLQDFTSIYFIPCDELNGACFIDYESCTEADPIDCAYSAVMVNASDLLDCSSDEGECLADYCATTPTGCDYITANDDFEAVGIYGELLE